MRRALIAITTCAGLLLPVPARADLKEGSYAPDIEAKEWLNTQDGQPISLAELRGMVVVMYFWVSWHKGGEAFMPLINMVENHPNLGRRRGVFILGVTEADRKRVEEMIEEERIFFPIGLESPSGKEYKLDMYPSVVVVDPTGKIAYSGWPGREGGQPFVDRILSVIGENPPTRTHPREAAEALRHLDAARTAIRKGDYKAAYAEARSAYDSALLGDDLKTRCQDMLDLLEALGRDKLADAVQLADQQKFAEAVAALRDVARLFRGLTVGKAAQKRLKGLEDRYPEVKKVLAALQREAEARGLLVAVRDALKERSFGEAYDTLQKLLKDFSDTPVASDAQTILRRMEKNPTIMSVVRDHQAEAACNNWLGQARSYARAGNFERARELLRKVIDTYPETRFADEAWRELGQLK